MKSVESVQSIKKFSFFSARLCHKFLLFFATFVAAAVPTQAEAFMCQNNDRPNSITLNAVASGVADVGQPIGEWIDLSATHQWQCKRAGTTSNINASDLHYFSANLPPSSISIVDGVKRFVYPGGTVAVEVESTTWISDVTIPGSGNYFAKQLLKVGSWLGSGINPPDTTLPYNQTDVLLKMRVIRLSEYVPPSISIPITIIARICYAPGGSGIGCQDLSPLRTINLVISLTALKPPPPTSCIAGVSSPVINLGTFHSYQFPNVGDVTPDVPFSMYINCPVGPSFVKYRFQPVNGTSPGNGILPKLDVDNSSAYKVQVMNGDSGNTALMFSDDFYSDFYWMPYTPGTEGNHSIPLRARIIKETNSGFGGAVEAQMMMVVEHD